MAVVLEGGCRVSQMREGAPVVNGTLSIWNQIGRAQGAQAISLRALEFAPGLSPGIRNDECDELLYVLPEQFYDRAAIEDRSQGEAHNALDRDESINESPEMAPQASQSIEVFIDGHGHDVGADTGAYVRAGETFAVNNPHPHSVILISAQCPDPDCEPNFIEPLTTPPPDATRPESPPLVRLADRAAQPTADRWYRVLVDSEIGSEQVTQFVGSIPPGRAPDHFHNYEEVLFILKGRGRMWASGTNTLIAPGSCIYLPRGQIHCVENTGRDELRLLGVFYPAGSPSVRYDV